MRDESTASPAALILVGAAVLVAAAFLWRHPEVFARRNFPFNWMHDESTPRRWVVAASVGGFGLALIALGLASL